MGVLLLGCGVCECVCVRVLFITFHVKCQSRNSIRSKKPRDTQYHRLSDATRTIPRKDTCQRPNYCNQTKNEYHKATRKKKQKLLQIFQSILGSTGRCHWVCRVFTFFFPLPYKPRHTLTTAKNTTQSRFGYDQQLCFYPRGFESSCD